MVKLDQIWFKQILRETHFIFKLVVPGFQWSGMCWTKWFKKMFFREKGNLPILYKKEQDQREETKGKRKVEYRVLLRKKYRKTKQKESRLTAIEERSKKTEII